MDHRRHALELCLVFLTFVLPAILGAPRAAELAVTSALLPLVLAAVPQTGLLIYLLALQGEAGRPELGLRPPKAGDATWSLLSLAAMAALAALAAFLLSRLPEEARRDLARGARFRLAGARELPAAVLFCATVAAREEVLYRVYLTTRLADVGLGAAAAMVVSSALFALAHGYEGPLAVILALLQGLLLAGAFARSRSVAVPVAAHATYNLLVLASSLLPGGGIPL